MDWQVEPEPAIGEPQSLFELESSISVTDFDPRRERFLGVRQQKAEGRRILLRTGWVDAQAER